MKVFAQILGTATIDSSPSLLLFLDNQRFLFNSGEGTQRFCVEHKVRLSKINDVFLTSLSTDSAAGLPGLVLSLADLGNSQLKLHGPPNLSRKLLSTRWFIHKSKLRIEVNEYNSTIGRDGPLLRAKLAATEPGPTQRETQFRASLPEIGIFPVVITSLPQEVPRGSPPHKRARKSEEDKTASGSGSGSGSSKPAVTVVNLSAIMPSKAIYDTDFNERAATSGGSCEESGGCSHAHSKPSSKFIDQSALPEAVPAGSHAVCYVCHTPDVPGKFDPKRAKELGIPAGPNYGKLCRGESITTPSGRVIHPSEVVSPSTPGPVLIIVHCPSKHFLESLCNHPAWSNYAASGDSHPLVACILHIAPMDVISTPEYKHFMNSFSPECQHVVINREVCAQKAPFLASAQGQCKLNMIHPTFFPLPFSRAETPAAELLSAEGFPRKIAAGDNLMKFILGPLNEKGLDCSAIVPPIDPDQIKHEVLNPPPIAQPEPASPAPTASGKGGKGGESKKKGGSEKNAQVVGDAMELTKAACLSESRVNPAELLASISAMQEAMKALESAAIDQHTCAKFSSSEASKMSDEFCNACHERVLEAMGHDEAEIVFFGTGSAIPSKYRNVSSIYLHLFARGGIVLDCGEDTVGQFRRKYGDKFDEVLRGIKLVWISHMHADHHCGLPRLLSERQLVADDEVVVVGPSALDNYLREYNAHVTPLNYRFFDSSKFADSASESPELASFLSESFGITSLQNVPVVHCRDSYGLVLQHSRGWKLVYSGDTRPSSKLIERGMDATVLMHEATFEDGMLEEAQAKRHSTTSEAIESGTKMRAYRTILTHFSQRYPKIPQFDDISCSRTTVAFDFMSINFKNLKIAPLTVGPLKHLFVDEIEELDQRAGGEN